jgi:hypothetical protein
MLLERLKEMMARKKDYLGLLVAIIGLSILILVLDLPNKTNNFISLGIAAVVLVIMRELFNIIKSKNTH